MTKLKPLSGRTFISLSLFLAFAVMFVTSLLLFINRHNTTTAMMHTVLGFLFLTLALWHLKNNLAPLKQYLKLRTRSGHLNKPLIAALFLAPAMALGAYFHAPPLLSFYEWGNAMRARDRAVDQAQFHYVRVNRIHTGAAGVELAIDLRKGPYFQWPQYAIWLETLSGELIEPVYVTGKLASNSFDIRVVRKTEGVVFTSNPLQSEDYDPEQLFGFIDEPETREERVRPESLPVFLHRLGVDLHAQTDMAPLDAYTGATLLDNFLLSTRTRAVPDGPFKVMLEINQSFDFNEYWSSNRFPEDPVYSGDGYSAQPSLVYEAVIDPQSRERYYPMHIIGRGHHSGRDGQIHADISQMTTALELIDRVIVEVELPGAATTLIHN